MLKLQGSCTVGCGACCQHFFLPKPPDWGIHLFDDNFRFRLAIALPVGYPDESVEWLEAHGLEMRRDRQWAVWPNVPRYREVHQRGRMVLRFDVPCPHLTEAKLCDLHGTDAKPRVCRDYPSVHTDLSSVTPPCTVTIAEVQDAADL